MYNVAEHGEVAGHRFRGVVAFGDGDAEQPGGFERRVGEAIDGELDPKKRLGVFHQFPIQPQPHAHVQPIFRMRFRSLTDQVFALFRWLWGATAGALRGGGS
jgi:hypothetical protein